MLPRGWGYTCTQKDVFQTYEIAVCNAKGSESNHEFRDVEGLGWSLGFPEGN